MITYLIIAVLVITARGDELRPGFTVSSSIDGINQVSHMFTPYVFSNLNNISLGVVNYTLGIMDDITLKLHEPESLEDIMFSLNPKKNSVIFQASNLFAQI